jgi:hypothetical protein
MPPVPSAAGYTTAPRYELWLTAATYPPAGSRTGAVIVGIVVPADEHEPQVGSHRDESLFSASSAGQIGSGEDRTEPQYALRSTIDAIEACRCQRADIGLPSQC